MAGTGLPIPKSGDVLTQPTPVIDGDKLSSAQAWTQIAHAGGQIAQAGLGAMELEAQTIRAGAVADFENRQTRTYTDMRETFRDNPEGFDRAAKAHNDGAIAEVPTWMVPHATKFLGGRANATYAVIQNEKAAKDRALANDALKARLTAADDDAVTSFSTGRGATDGATAIQTFNGVLDSLVSGRLIPPERAALLRDDLVFRTVSADVRHRLAGVYEEKGFSGAREWLQTTVGELQKSHNISDKIVRDGLSWLKTQEAGFKGERDTIAREWAAAKPQVETLEPDVLLDMAQRADAVGSSVGRDIRATLLATQITRDLRGLPATTRAGIAASGQAPASAFNDRLMQRESGGNPAVVNSFGFSGLFQFGAPRLETLGVYTAGAGENMAAWSKSGRNAPGKWSGTFNIPGFPQVKTLQDFLASPDAQRATYELHRAKMDEEITQNGFDRYIDQTVGGVVVTRAGLHASLHLSGVGGTRRLLESAGTDLARDANGSSALDYLRLGEGVDLTQSREGLIALRSLKKEMAVSVTKRIADFASADRKLELPSMDEIAQLGAEVAVVGTPEQKRRVAEIAAESQYGQQWAALPAAKREEAIGAWNARLQQGGPKFERELRDHLVNAQKRMETAFKDDPYGAGYRHIEGMPPLPAIDFSKPNVPEMLRTKVEQQATIRALENMPAFSAFRPAEAAAVAQSLTQDAPQVAAGILGALAGNLPQDVLVATLSDGPMKAALEGMVRTYDPARLNIAMGAMDNLWRANPLAFKAAFGEETQTRLQVWQSLRGSHSPPEIAERFKRADDPSTQDARKKLGEAADTETKSVKPGAVATFLYQSDHSVLGRAAVIGPGGLGLIGPSAPSDGLQAEVLAREFAARYREFRQFGLDAGQAREKAVERLKLTWGGSDVAGGQLMKHPPERHYSEVDGGRQWMTRDLEAAIAAQVGKPRRTVLSSDTPKDARLGENWSYRILADAQTEADIAAGRKPSYLVTVTDAATGMTDAPIDASGRPMRFRWNEAAALDSAREQFDEGRLEAREAGAAREAAAKRVRGDVRGEPYAPMTRDPIQDIRNERAALERQQRALDASGLGGAFRTAQQARIGRRFRELDEIFINSGDPAD